MSEIVNLRRAKKAKARHAKDVVSAANRAEHGISKSAHNLAKAKAALEKRSVDARRLEKDE